MRSKKGWSVKRRLLAGAGVAGIVGFGAAYRFAAQYRARVGWPHRHPVEGSPADFGLAFEPVSIPSGSLDLSGWFVPVEGGRVGPAVVIVHGWESNRGRSLAHVRYLRQAGFHCLVIDVRGHGDSPTDELPISVPEFADDAIAAVRWLGERTYITRIGLLGHSMGGAGAIVAASREPLVSAVVSMSAPADLVSMTRTTFDLAEMRIPEPIATPLAWFTAAMLLVPRRHRLEDASARGAAARYRGPLLLIHGGQDRGVPVEHLDLIASAAEERRAAGDAEVETLVLPEMGHRWLYEEAACRRAVVDFFARSLGGMDPSEAADRAAAVEVRRPDDPIYGFGAMPAKPGAGRPPAKGLDRPPAQSEE